MNSRQGQTDRTVNAIALVEEVCLAALLDDLAESRRTGGLSPEETTTSIGHGPARPAA